MVKTMDVGMAIFDIARLTNTPYDEIIEALTGIAWDEEEAGDLMQILCHIYGGFDND